MKSVSHKNIEALTSDCMVCNHLSGVLSSLVLCAESTTSYKMFIPKMQAI